MGKEIDHDNTPNIVCPYCGYEESDSWEVQSDYEDEYDCMNCDKQFTMQRHISVSYSTTKN